MENKDIETGAPMQESTSERFLKNIRIIRFILLSTVLYIITDTIGRWFLPDDIRVPGIYLALIWVLCLITGAFQFYVWRKLEVKWVKWAVLAGYLILFPVVLALCRFYRSESPGLIGYRISVTFMPAFGFLIVSLTAGFIRWYGNMIKKVFHLESINNMLFFLFMLIPVALVILLFIGGYRLSGFMSHKGDKIEQLVTEGEVNPNKDHREPVRQYDRIFNDINDTQLKAAKKNGLRKSITIEEAESSPELVKINSDGSYAIDKLTHSIPYLVPKAARLLEDMGKAFQDSIFNRGYSRHHRFTVTSVLRTDDHVRQLRKTNVNSTEQSCHCYGTTFDISYYTFQTPLAGTVASVEKMRQVLMQVAYDMRRQNRCYVKYEKQQPCLHITVR